MKNQVLLFAFVLWLSTLEAAVSAVHTRASIPIPDGWLRLERAPRETDIKLTVALKQRNLNVLDSIFWNVSNPKSSSYGKYLKVDDITAIVSPDEETIRTVNLWLDAHDIKQRTLNRNR